MIRRRSFLKGCGAVALAAMVPALPREAVASGAPFTAYHGGLAGGKVHVMTCQLSSPGEAFQVGDLLSVWDGEDEWLLNRVTKHELSVAGCHADIQSKITLKEVPELEVKDYGEPVPWPRVAYVDGEFAVIVPRGTMRQPARPKWQRRQRLR